MLGIVKWWDNEYYMVFWWMRPNVPQVDKLTKSLQWLVSVCPQQLQSSVVGRENSRRYFEAVQGTDGQSGELFGMRNLFRLQLDGTCLTQRILEVRCHPVVDIWYGRGSSIKWKAESGTWNYINSVMTVYCSFHLYLSFMNSRCFSLQPCDIRFFH